jgi:predicted DNA-binding mobile mystery protein A
MTRFDNLRLRQLDSSLAAAKALRSRPPPPQGWIRTIREALGMSLRQLAERAGVSKSAVASIERNEAKGTVRLESLARLAEAMECELVYAIVPCISLEETVSGQAMRAAERVVGRVADSMALEAQATSDDERARLVREMATRLRESPSGTWDA